MKKALFFLAVSFLISSCSNVYKLAYDTYLVNAKPEKSLHYFDDYLTFDFYPVHNGIYFKVKNLTQESAYIIWDKSYFIAPDGNSSKALNTDILDQDKAISNKEKYESIIPPNAYFSRFTTSALNISRYSFSDISTITGYFSNNKYSSTTVIFNEGFSHENYWPIRLLKSEEVSNTEVNSRRLIPGKLKKTSEYIKENNNLGVGFAIRIGDIVKEYKFDFKFSAVTVYEVSGSEATPVYRSMQSNNWEFYKVEKN
jgi:hypothetical protein